PRGRHTGRRVDGRRTAPAGVGVSAGDARNDLPSGVFNCVNLQLLRRDALTFIPSLIMWIVIGAIGGWLAGYVLTKDTKLQLNDVILGMVGAVVGGWLFRLVLGTPRGNLLYSILAAFVGAVIVDWIIRKVSG
ncbi:MAG: GlsB/YeaQ/YmgE family stress response membrane protein, partial [Anaerolineae bacterium]